MPDSAQWAQEKLKQANLISEPGDHSLGWQMGLFMLWTLEIALIWLLAGWLRP